MFLSAFGKGLQPATDQLSKAEAYLVKLFPHSKGLKTFNQLRVNHFLKTNSMLNLPPTSLAMHIAQWRYLVKVNTTLLYDASLKISRLDHGWIVIDDELLPQKHFNIIPEHFARKCHGNQEGLQQ